ncbi:MAG: hypothetical protein M3Q81_04595 [bacterium]|nr:hypothetical protein [bacterium]
MSNGLVELDSVFAFKQRRVGVIGFSKQLFDTELAEAAIVAEIIKVTKEFPDLELVIVSGYTNMGVPEIAHELANRYGLRTVGIACSKALSGFKAREFDLCKVDYSIIVGDEWGKESPTLFRYCHQFIRVGGGNQAHEEAAAIKAINKPITEYNLPALSS